MIFEFYHTSFIFQQFWRCFDQDVETAYRSCTTFVRENNEAIEEVEDHEGKPGKEPGKTKKNCTEVDFW